MPRKMNILLYPCTRAHLTPVSCRTGSTWPSRKLSSYKQMILDVAEPLWRQSCSFRSHQKCDLAESTAGSSAQSLICTQQFWLCSLQAQFMSQGNAAPALGTGRATPLLNTDIEKLTLLSVWKHRKSVILSSSSADV